ncbi:MAG: alpha-ketoglutarate-dependent dioxygenase AlkB [Acidobacteriota bacterium]
MKPGITLIDDFLDDHEILFQDLSESVQWDDRMAARRTASFSEPYNYSQMTYPAAAIPSALSSVIELLRERLGITFNNCLLNFYKTGDNRMGFHSDDTTNLVRGTGVAILSLGNPRSITYRSKADKAVQHSFVLRPGSLLYMDSLVQEHWLHGIRKQKDAGPRISLTWRAFNTTGD